MKHRGYNQIHPDALADLSGPEAQEYERIWDMAAGYYGAEPDESEYRAMGAEIWETVASATRPRIRRVFFSPRYYLLAACFAILMAVSITLLNRSISIEAPLGPGLTSEVLPDGSILAVNSGSEVRYSRKFGDSHRDLILTRGEIFFDVTEDDVPFRVHTGNMVVEVHGTSFNVRYWPDEIDPSTQVAVTSGIVSVLPKSAPENVRELRAGESASLRRGHNLLEITSASPQAEPEKPSWMQGHFKYTNIALGDVMAEVERRFAVTIDIEDDSGDLRRLPKGILKESPASAEEIIADVCAYTCNYRRPAAGRFVLTPH
ncbi:MAG: FecR domain-containing protein [Bacteroidota bacterium]|nr:FecR domain-containing protein [Bacteroidota bacterium]